MSQGGLAFFFICVYEKIGGIVEHQNYGQEKQEGTAQVGQIKENGKPECRTPSVGASGGKGARDGTDSLGFSGNAGDRGKHETVGGILRQLKQTKESYLEYVNAHTERLKLRLAEDETQRKQLMDDIARLESEICELEESESDLGLDSSPSE